MFEVLSEIGKQVLIYIPITNVKFGREAHESSIIFELL
jgi:hypothetical protein